MTRMRGLVSLAFALLLLATTRPLLGAEAEGQKSPRFLVHLLDYLAKDYAGAVGAGGQVLSASEYKEQQEFAAMAEETAKALPELKDQTDITAAVTHVRELIGARAEPVAVAAAARDVQQRVIQTTHLETAPSRWPSLARGRELFAVNCVGCHGAEGRGDGPAGVQLQPKPANFQDEARMGEVSPLQAFDTVRLGVPNTGMPPFPTLDDAETWDLAFYVISLRHGATASNSAEPADFGADRLRLAATSSDALLRRTLPAPTIDALRLHSGAELQADSLGTARTLLEEALTAYRAGRQTDAKTLALKAYLEGIEPVEPRVRATDPAAVVETEARMSSVRAAIEGHASADDVASAVKTAEAQIDVLKDMLGHKDLSPGVAFTAASSILLREGFEAVLMILALLGVIRAAGSKRAALWVHAGWISALACGGAAWAFSGYLMDISGKGRETLEAWTSLFAVVVLLFVGFWLHSRTEIGRWNHFLKVKVRQAMQGKSLIGLASISFIAVFREAFETVLFLRAIWLEGGHEARTAMTTAVVLTIGLIIAGAAAVLRYSTRIPVRKLFGASAVIMAALAVILTGKGLHSLQETGALPVTTALLPVRWDVVGVYPTWETLGPQVLVLALVCTLWMVGKRPTLLRARARA